ncbi:hypothetical protein SAMN05892877_102364 [Rhizobium subbaraonis]|uniref:MFS transporter n=1 Tax=Rhizobium subbaraonis TaxID=908946 RepID=A0A285U797_9HYPH|nr:hypothetical protein [Rhizobium subbaraonis]SOC36151.1 hypothetical protein SAMN05892877_102364 [Rhizobium subbaraonis]
MAAGQGKVHQGAAWIVGNPVATQVAAALPIGSADPSPRTALLVPAAQLLGAALGPAGASLLISDEDVRAVPFFGMACLAATLLLLAVFCLKAGGNGISRSAIDTGKDNAA